MNQLTNAEVLIGLVLGLGAILGGIARLLHLANRQIRAHQQLVADVALLLRERPKNRRRFRRIEAELDLRPRARARVTTTTTTQQTHESEPIPT